jgi:formate dehydrogenase maturation protein FdhE
VHATFAGSTGSRLSQLSWPSSSILRPKKIQVTKGKKKKFTEPPFLPQNSEHVYQQRCDYKKKRRKAQQHKLAKNPTFVSCVAKAKKNIYSKRRKEREKKSEGRLPVNG